jgi:hypothetical protein
VKQAKCGKYVLIGKIVAQLLFTTQVVWLSQALAMYVECSYMVDTQQIPIESPWKVLSSLYFCLIRLRKVKRMGKSPNRDRK